MQEFRSKTFIRTFTKWNETIRHKYSNKQQIKRKKYKRKGYGKSWFHRFHKFQRTSGNPSRVKFTIRPLKKKSIQNQKHYKNHLRAISSNIHTVVENLRLFFWVKKHTLEYLLFGFASEGGGPSLAKVASLRSHSSLP